MIRYTSGPADARGGGAYAIKAVPCSPKAWTQLTPAAIAPLCPHSTVKPSPSNLVARYQLLDCTLCLNCPNPTLRTSSHGQQPPRRQLLHPTSLDDAHFSERWLLTRTSVDRLHAKQWGMCLESAIKGIGFRVPSSPKGQEPSSHHQGKRIASARGRSSLVSPKALESGASSAVAVSPPAVAVSPPRPPRSLGSLLVPLPTGLVCGTIRSKVAARSNLRVATDSAGIFDCAIPRPQSMSTRLHVCRFASSVAHVSDFAGAMCRFSFIFLFLFIPRAPLCGKSASWFAASLSTLWSLSESPHVVEPNAAPSQDI